MKLLIVEDEALLAQSIAQYLESEHYICSIASDFHGASEKIALYEYDCFLLDITLPNGNGLDFIADIKTRHPKAGIIVISAKNALDDKIFGLNKGADDYLPKPFHLAELSARINAVVRRKEFNGSNIITYHELSIHTDERILRINNTEVKLTRSEYTLLLYFLANINRVLSKESLAEHLVGDDADMMNNFDFVYSHIKNLRKKLIVSGTPDYIKAVYGIGYKFSDQ